MCRRGVSMAPWVPIQELKGKLEEAMQRPASQTGKRAHCNRPSISNAPALLFRCSCAMGRMRVMAAGTDDEATLSP